MASARITTEKFQTYLQELNNSLPFDKVLYREDIQGSLAHALMLSNQGNNIGGGLSKIT